MNDTKTHRTRPTADWHTRVNACYEASADLLVSKGFTRLHRRAGDIFRRRQDGLEIQLTRKLCSTEWKLREVGTMKQIQMHELRATTAA